MSQLATASGSDLNPVGETTANDFSSQPDEAGVGTELANLMPPFVRQMVMSGRAKFSWARMQLLRASELTQGQHFGSEPTPNGDKNGRATERRGRQPVNLSMQQEKTLLWYLSYSAGQPNITAKFSQDEAHATILNKLAEEDFATIKLVDQIQLVLQQMIRGGLGIVKTGVKAGTRVYSDGTTDLDPGEFFAQYVSLDDFVCDPLARQTTEFRWAGYMNRVSRTDCLNAKLYGRDPGELDPAIAQNKYIATRDEAEQILNAAVHLRSASAGSGEVSGLTGTGGQSSGIDTDRIVLWELEWRIDGEMYTIVLPANPTTGDPATNLDKFLLIEKCQNLKKGSLRYLWALPSLDNPMPQALEGMQRDLAITADSIARKITRSAMEAKQGAIYDKSEEDVAKQVRKAPDNFLLAGNGTKFAQLKLAGLVDELMPAQEFVMSHWNNVTAQAQLAAGGEPNTDSKTLGEYQGRSANSQGWTQYLAMRLEGLVGEVLEDWVGFKLADTTLSQQIPFPLGGGQTMPLTVTPDILHNQPPDFSLTPQMVSARQAQFYYHIRATSMRPVDPAMEANQLIQFTAQALPQVVAAIQSGVYKPGSLRVMMEGIGVKRLDEICADPELAMQQFQTMQMGPGDVWGGQPQQPQPPAPPPMMGGPPPGAPQRPGAPQGGPPKTPQPQHRPVQRPRPTAGPPAMAGMGMR